MPLLRKLADCMGYLGQAALTGPPIAGALNPVATVDDAWGWQGNLFQSNAQTGALAAGTVGASITITEDCFYDLDACGIASEQTLVGSVIRRCAFEVLDTAGQIVWQIARTWIGGAQTAVGIVTQVDGGDITKRFHLLKDMVVRWRTLDAMSGTGGAFSSSIALRKLYQDTL